MTNIYKFETNTTYTLEEVFKRSGQELRDIWLDKPKYIVKHTTNRHKRRALKKMRLKNETNRVNKN